MRLNRVRSTFLLGALLAVAAVWPVDHGAAQQADPDLSVCRAGAAQSAIEAQVGPATTVRELPHGGEICSYDFVMGEKTSAERMQMHGDGAVDTLATALWGVAGASGAPQGRYRMTVIYDDAGEAREISIIEMTR